MTRLITLIGSFCLLFLFSYGQHHSLYFSGENDMLQMDAAAGNGVRTIQLWFKPDKDYDETNGAPATIIYRDASNQFGEFGLYIGPSDWTDQEGKLVFSRNVSGQRYLITSDASSWESGKWYHVIAYIDPNTGMRMYVNGVLQTDEDNSVPATDVRTEHITVGSWGVSGFRSFKGEIDDISLWDRVLTVQELDQFMRQDAVGSLLFSGILAYWDFNEGTGTTASDKMGHMDVSVDSSQWRSTGTAIRLDNENPYVALATESGGGLRSIELWFRPESYIDNTLTDPAGILYRETPDGKSEYGLYIGSSNWVGQEGKLCFNIHDQDGISHRVVSDQSQWFPTQWYHVVGVVDPVNGMRLYVDGQLQNDNNFYNQATEELEYPPVLGKWGFRDIRYYKGLVDDVRLWKRVLTTDEIADHRCGSSIDTTSLEAYWALDEGLDSIATDLSANQYAGFMISNDKWEEIRNCYQTAAFQEVTTSVPDTPLPQRERLTIQPNPVTTDTQIFFPDNNYREWRWQLFNNLGQLLQQGSGSGSVIHFSREDHSPGMYYLHVTDQATTEEFVEKLILQ